MIMFCQKCQHHYTTERGSCTICGCNCSEKPLFMTCALPPPELLPGRYVAGPGLAPDSFRVPDPRISALENRFDDHSRSLVAAIARISYLEEQIGKIPPLLDRIAAMEKTLAKLPSLNPSIVKALRENVDWTKVVSDEEDLLEDGYRGWPEEKKRTIF
jgi:hypothetical protein